MGGAYVSLTKQLAVKCVLSHGFLQFTFHLHPETNYMGTSRGTGSQAQALFLTCLLLCAPTSASPSITSVGYIHTLAPLLVTVITCKLEEIQTQGACWLASEMLLRLFLEKTLCTTLIRTCVCLI